MPDWTTTTAAELVGVTGTFRLAGGGVRYDTATVEGGAVRLSRGGEQARYVEPDQPMQALLPEKPSTRAARRAAVVGE